MSDKKSKNQDDLDLGQINLLPEDLRASAEKYKRSRKSDETVYQLRAPKKIRKRRRVWAWLPFFGGAHWEVLPDARGKSETAAPKFPETSVITTPSPATATQQDMAATSNEFGTITPVFGQKTGTGSVSPKAKRSFKGGFSFASFFGRKKPVIPTRPASSEALRSTQAPQSTSGFTTPARHYSLLSESPGAAGTPPGQIASVQVTPIETIGSVVHGSRPITPQGLPQTGASPAKKSRWRVPKWLDIFTLLGFLTRFGKTRGPKPQKKLTPLAAQGTQSPSSSMPSTEPLRPIQPFTANLRPLDNQSELGKGMTPITPVPVAKTAELLKTSAPLQKTPAPLPSGKPTKKHVPWHLPKWLDIFYLLSLLHFKKKPVGQRPLQTPLPPQPPTVSKLALTPLSLEEKPSTASIPITPPPVASVDTKTWMATPSIPQTPVSSTTAVRPAGSTPAPLTSNDIIPIADDSAGLKEKKSKQHRNGLFHIPTKTAFATASKELREINLIPGAYFAPRGWKQIGQSVALTIVAACFVIGLAYWGLQAWRQQVEERTATIDAQISAFKDDILIYNKQEPEMSALGNRVELVAQLLKRHIYWTHFFKLLEKYTLADVYYDGVTLGAHDNTLTLNAHGPSFKTVSEELLFLNAPEAQEFVTSATITSAQLTTKADDTEEVNFSILLTLNPNVFYYDAPQN